MILVRLNISVRTTNSPLGLLNNLNQTKDTIDGTNPDPMPQNHDIAVS